MRKRVCLIAVFFVFLLCSGIGKTDSSKQINLKLEYKAGSPWDADNNGIESDDSIIDFTIEKTTFNWNVNEEKLCTIWQIYSLDNYSTANLCYGAGDCCSFVNLEQEKEKWNETLYLQLGKYDATKDNKISARVIYLDYNLNAQPYSEDIAYSEWDYLYAVFLEKGHKQSLSSFILSSNASTVNLTIIAPENNSMLTTGEELYLNISLNLPYFASYSLDSENYMPIGYGLDFSSRFNGSLPFGVLENGQHDVTIYLWNYNSTLMNYSLFFIVNDTTSPIANITFNNKDLNNSIIENKNKSVYINLTVTETSLIRYKLNNLTAQEKYVQKNELGTTYLEVPEGISGLAVNVSDMNQNSNILYYSFNFSKTPSCSDGVKNGQETGIDCGGSCGICIPFEITIDKAVFELNEPITATVLARQNSFVYLDIIYSGNIISHEYIPSYSPDFPIFVTKRLSNINQPGNYTINATMFYMNTTENKKLYFYVNDSNRNTLSAYINANKTELDEGEAVNLESVADGNKSSITYKWNLNDGTTSTAKSLNYTYKGNGTYNVELVVYSAGFNATAYKTITVKRLFAVNVKVVNESGSPVGDAEVELEGTTKNTSSSGEASFLVSSGEYLLSVSKDDYLSFTNNTKIEVNTTVQVSLIKSKIDKNRPIITLISPGENENITSQNVKFRYRVNDASAVGCTLYLSIDNSWWIEKTHESGITSDSERVIEVTNLENNYYEWKIECSDSSANSDISNARSFYVDAEFQDIGQNTSDDIIQEIDDSLSSLDSLGKNEIDAINVLKIKEQLDEAKKQIQWANRDLNNLIWRKFNATEMEKARNSIYDKIESTKSVTPKTLRVIDTKEFVEYPSKEDINSICSQILELKNKTYKKTEKEAYIKYNQDLQNLISTTTKVKSIEIEYLAGNKKEIALIDKEIITKENLNNLTLVEYIPKELANDIKEIGFLFAYSTIKADPIISLNSSARKYSYYINKSIDLAKVNGIKTLVLGEKPVKKNKLLGWVTLESMPDNFIGESNARLLIEAIVIIILILIYFSSTLNFSKVMYMVKDRKSFKKMKEIKQEAEKALDFLKNNEYDKAKSIYISIKESFKELPKEIKKEAYAKIGLLSDKLNIYHISKLVDRAFIYIEDKEKKKAADIYNQISRIYKSISIKSKSDIYRRTDELYKKINEK